MPPERWKLPVLFASAIFAGFSIFAFYTGKAWTYASDDPKVCVNCHIMTPEYATWFHSSHRERAVCNDCHVPHNNILNHYFFKAKDGLRHSTLFTLRMEDQVIFIKEPGQAVVQQNCIRCHLKFVERAPNLAVSFDDASHGRGKLCWDCHRETPHGRVRSLAGTANARVPLLEAPFTGKRERRK